MTDLNRRDFLKHVALTGTGMQVGLLCPGLAKGSTAPKMSIAKYRTSPAEAEGIAEEAARLTRQAIDALGGMSRFVSNGQVVWVKPNIAWDRTPEQAGMPLLRQPFEPTPADAMLLALGRDEFEALPEWLSQAAA